MARRIRSSSLKNAAQQRLAAQEREERLRMPYTVEQRRIVVDGTEQQVEVKVYPSQARTDFADEQQVLHKAQSAAVFGGVQRVKRGSGC